jgi:hypothetical protein
MTHQNHPDKRVGGIENQKKNIKKSKKRNIKRKTRKRKTRKTRKK